MPKFGFFCKNRVALSYFNLLNCRLIRLVYVYTCGSIDAIATAGSTKACYGHTEGTAGLHGALLAVHVLQHCTAPPVQHNRELNPYVAAALKDWHSSSNITCCINRVLPALL